MSYQDARAIEPVDIGFGESIGSAQLWNVPSGCAVTYSNSDLKFDVAAGVVNLAGKLIDVAAQTNVTGFTADATYSTWAWITVDGSGTASVLLGTPAADPLPPDFSAAYTFLALVLIPAGATIANAIPTKLDKRIPCLTQSRLLATNFTKNNSTTFGDVGTLSFFCGASETWAWELVGQTQVGIAPGLKVLYTHPSAATLTGGAELVSVNDHAAGYSDWTVPVNMLPPVSDGLILHSHGTIAAGVNAGKVQLQAAQQFATVEDTILYAGMALRAYRIN